jgi:hypothetical protein
MAKRFEDCANCKGMILGGGQRKGELRFCSVACQRFYHQPGFCDSCVSQTTPEQVAATYAFRGLFGTRLLGFGKHCESCNSIIKRRWICVVLPREISDIAVNSPSLSEPKSEIRSVLKSRNSPVG